MTTLSGKQKRYLRGLGNRLKATVYIGQRGVSEAVVQAAKEALSASELVKVRLQEGYLGDRKNAADDIANQTDAQVVQILGNTILLFRRDDANPEIELPQ